MNVPSDTRSLLLWNALSLIRRVNSALRPGPLSKEAAAEVHESLAKAERLVLAARRLEVEEPPRTASLIALWIRSNGNWRHIETFDPTSPQFARSAAPTEYAWFEARRQAAMMMKADARIDACDVRRESR